MLIIRSDIEFGTTLVLVTHDLNLAQLARRTRLQLADGQVIEDTLRAA